jgi:hypothetical protein
MYRYRHMLLRVLSCLVLRVLSCLVLRVLSCLVLRLRVRMSLMRAVTAGDARVANSAEKQAALILAMLHVLCHLRLLLTSRSTPLQSKAVLLR